MDAGINVERVLEAMRQYDQEIWPLPFLSTMLGLVIMLLALHRTPSAGRFICSLLALSWVWIGVEFQGLLLGHFQPAGELASALFVIQGLLLFWHGVLMGRLTFIPRSGAMGLWGGALLAYSLAAYPLLSELVGRGALAGLSLGLAPGPTTIFTLGLLLWSDDVPPLDLVAIPLLWSLLGCQGAWILGQWQDLFLPVAGLAGAGMIAQRRWRARREGGREAWQAGS